jgi:hypothetical protein
MVSSRDRKRLPRTLIADIPAAETPVTCDEITGVLAARWR